MKSESREEIKVEVCINISPTKMKLDTEPSVSLISEKLFEKKFKRSVLCKIKNLYWGESSCPWGDGGSSRIRKSTMCRQKC